MQLLRTAAFQIGRAVVRFKSIFELIDQVLIVSKFRNLKNDVLSIINFIF